ncbi:MAG: TetR/AcrR family transcriptional regulator [Actinomycetota bacterium]
MSKELTENGRRRLPRQERERLIVEEAIRFFADVGLEGQTRALADRLGVTQPLLYRYFPDKDALIERVFSEISAGGWDPAWSAALADRSRPLAERMVEFYGNYICMNFGRERLRLFMYASLKDQDAARRYLSFVRTHLLLPLVAELRAEAGLDLSRPVDEAEVECVAGLHGAIAYVAARRWIYGDPAATDERALVRQQVQTFLEGAAVTMKRLAP